MGSSVLVTQERLEANRTGRARDAGIENCWIGWRPEPVLEAAGETAVAARE